MGAGQAEKRWKKLILNRSEKMRALDGYPSGIHSGTQRIAKKKINQGFALMNYLISSQING